MVDGVKSSMLEVKAVVPQGSRLGPLLFLKYINDIVNDIESERMIFADDTTLLASGTETASQLNKDLSKISAWAEQWKVTFNAGKSRDDSYIATLNTHKHLFRLVHTNK